MHNLHSIADYAFFISTGFAGNVGISGSFPSGSCNDVNRHWVVGTGFRRRRFVRRAWALLDRNCGILAGGDLDDMIDTPVTAQKIAAETQKCG